MNNFLYYYMNQDNQDKNEDKEIRKGVFLLLGHWVLPMAFFYFSILNLFEMNPSIKLYEKI